MAPSPGFGIVFGTAVSMNIAPALTMVQYRVLGGRDSSIPQPSSEAQA